MGQGRERVSWWTIHQFLYRATVKSGPAALRAGGRKLTPLLPTARVTPLYNSSEAVAFVDRCAGREPTGREVMIGEFASGNSQPQA